MTDVETPAAAPTPTPVPTPTVDVSEAIAPPDAGEGIQEGEAPVAVEVPEIDPEEWWEEQTTSNPKIKEWDETRREELRKTTHSEVQRRLQPILERADRTAKEFKDTAQQALSYGYQLFQVAQKAEKEGALPEGELMQAIAQYAPGYVQLLTGLSATAQYYDAAQELTSELGETVGDPKLADQFNARWRHLMAVGASPDEKKLLAREIWEAAVEKEGAKREEKGYKRGLKEGSGTATVAAKGEARARGGPDTAQGAGGGGITSMADAEARYLLRDGDPRKISHEDFKAWRERFGVK